jgi:hypothetical protein
MWCLDNRFCGHRFHSFTVCAKASNMHKRYLSVPPSMNPSINHAARPVPTPSVLIVLAPLQAGQIRET